MGNESPSPPACCWYFSDAYFLKTSKRFMKKEPLRRAHKEDIEGIKRSKDSCSSLWKDYLRQDVKEDLKRGLWRPDEDVLLVDYINEHGHGNWCALPKKAGIGRSHKSCRNRWMNYLRPDIKHGSFSLAEIKRLMELHRTLGNRWSAIAAQLPGRTDNEIKNFWKTKPMQCLVTMGLAPETDKPASAPCGSSTKIQTQSSTCNKAQLECAWLAFEAWMSRESLIYNPDCSVYFDCDPYLRLLAPRTRKPALTSPGPSTMIRTQSSMCNKAPLECAWLEVEAWIARESLIYNPDCSVYFDYDPYLRLWNSEVGEPFRKFERKENADKITCQNSVSWAGYYTQYFSNSGLITVDTCFASKPARNINEDIEFPFVLLNPTNSSWSDEVEDSSLHTLKLLLDFPENNDMSFFNDLSDDYSIGLF